MTADGAGGDARCEAAAVAYAYQPRLGGPGRRFSLQAGRLLWEAGPQKGELALADVRAVRLRLLPAKLGQESFETEIRGRGGERLRLASVSRQSLTAVRDQGADYAAFVRALLAALAAQGPDDLDCRGGYPALRWSAMATLGGATLAALLGVLGFALAQGDYPFALLFSALLAVLAWPAGRTVWRNRPVTFRPEAVPTHLLPA